MPSPMKIQLSSRRGARAVACSVLGLSLVACLAARVLNYGTGTRADPPLAVVVFLVILAVAGFVVAWARPRNVIGWVLLTGAALQAVSVLTTAYAHGFGVGRRAQGAPACAARRASHPPPRRRASGRGR